MYKLLFIMTHARSLTNTLRIVISRLEPKAPGLFGISGDTR